MTRRGVTLLELLMVLTLTSGVVLAGVALLRTAGSAFRRAEGQLSTQRLVSTVGSLLRYELTGLGVGDVTLTATGLFLPRRVGEAFPCAVSGTALLVAAREWRGVRQPEAGRDLGWISGRDGVVRRLPVQEVVPSVCPDGREGWRLGFDQPVGGIGYLQVVERTRLAVYTSAGVGWFGLAPADGSAAIQPMAGPVSSECSGLMLTEAAVRLSICHGVLQTTTRSVPLRGLVP